MQKKLFLSIALHFISLLSYSQKIIDTDVLVVGGSTGGTAAGIQSAHLGVNTIIIEETKWLGGMLTAAGVSCTDGNDQLPSGMWQEFREALYQHYGTQNLFTGWVSNTCFEPHVGDSIFKSWAAKEKKLTVMYGWYFDHATKNNNRVTGAIFKNKKGESLTVKAIITIDATDLGDVFASAGAVYDLGMEDKSYSGEDMALGKNTILQDLTWAAVVKNYGAGADKTLARPSDYDSTLYFCCCLDAPCSTERIQKATAQKMLGYGRLPRNKFMINWPAHGNDYYANVVEVEPIHREKALAKAKLKTLGFIYFIQTQLDFKNIGLADDEFDTEDRLALVPYHREGRRLRGVVRLNVNHLAKPFEQSEKLYRTGIAVGDYPVDHHHAPEKNVPEIDFPKIPSFNVPLGALIPETIDGLVVCEKGISISNIANGSTRLQPCVLLTGQAAGILAAQSTIGKKQPRSCNVRAVQESLLKQKSYVMPYLDVQPNDANWEAAQRVGAAGLMKGTGKAEGWANKTFFYPDSTITYLELANSLREWDHAFGSNGEPDRVLTIADAMKAVSLFYKKSEFRTNLATTNKTFDTERFWTETMALSNFNASRPIKRIELAKVLDYMLTNFLNFEVTLKGEVRRLVR
jgi:hypothetical protein